MAVERRLRELETGIMKKHVEIDKEKQKYEKLHKQLINIDDY